MKTHVTDRAHRYRANRNMPATAPICAFCGSTENVEVGHIDGHEENSSPENLIWTCRRCNVLCANNLRAHGIGRLTHQYNPPLPGAKTLTEWREATETVKGEGAAMPIDKAIRMLQATPANKRTKYARALKNNPPANKNKTVPTYQQYALATTMHCVGQEPHCGAHDEGGAIIHATPPEVRRQYARRIAREKKSRARWNPAAVVWRNGEVVYAGDDKQRAENLAIDLLTTEPESKIHLGILAANPAGRFERCVREVSAKGGAEDPAAVCAAAGRRKYGQAEMTRRAAAGRRRAKRGNPVEAAADVFEGFHGYPPADVQVFEENEHEHLVTADVGELISLTILPEGETKRARVLENFAGARLTMGENRKKPQLFIVGGDQRIDDLAPYNIDTDNIHELEMLGYCVSVEYYTTKTHLGKDGGEADYHHEFGKASRRRGVIEYLFKQTRKYKLPAVIYDTVNHKIKFAGGSYSLPDEGITN